MCGGLGGRGHEQTRGEPFTCPQSLRLGNLEAPLQKIAKF